MGSLSLNIRLPKRSLSSIYPEYSTETRRWVIRCLRSKLTLVFIWKNKTTLHVLLEPKGCSFKIIYAIVYDRPEICLCSLVQTKPDFSLVSIICKRSRKAKTESYIIPARDNRGRAWSQGKSHKVYAAILPAACVAGVERGRGRGNFGRARERGTQAILSLNFAGGAKLLGRARGQA